MCDAAALRRLDDGCQGAMMESQPITSHGRRADDDTE
jgi:hypothetical protein